MVDAKAHVWESTHVLQYLKLKARQSKPKSILFSSKKLIYCDVSTHNMESFLHKPINHVDALE